ncbi:MAG: N-methyl-L-tryptophan oxidase [bacterium]
MRLRLSMIYDVIVAGLGAMGSAATYHLAKRGVRVLGLDRFTPPHAFGSSHGDSRIIREAYFEHPLYVPLVQRAYELWHELERETRERLFLQTGGLMIGPPEGTLVQGALLSARTHHLTHELLDAAALRRRHSVFHPGATTAAVWEPRAGVLFPEKCITAHLQLARHLGASLHFEETVHAWRQERHNCEVQTDRGNYRASKLVFTAGAWLAGLLPDIKLPLHCTRQTLFWFDPASHREAFEPQRFPVFIFEHDLGRYFYGLPDLGEGVKVAIHHEGETTTPETIPRAVQDEAARPLRALLKKYLPAAAGTLRKTSVCMYTNAPDGHFLIDFYSDSSQVLLVSACSGHGFKFSSAIGELVAQLLLDGRARFDLVPFRLSR